MKVLTRDRPNACVLSQKFRMGALQRKSPVKVAKAGRYVETKDQLGGILMLKARDLDHAIQLISRDRALDLGAWQIRLAADLNEVMKKSKQLRAETTR